MAALIPDGTSSYFQHFASGNTIEGEGSPFITYAANMDTNFVLLRNTINTLIGEFTAAQGANQALPLDVFLLDDPDGVGVTNGGVVGAHSYEVSHDSADTVTVQSGVAVVLNTRVALAIDTNLAGGALGNATWWIALDVAGNLSFEAGADQQDLDIATVVRSGGSFTGAVTQLADIIHDQDAWQAMRTRPVSSAAPNDAFPAKTFRTIEPRFRAIERLLSGLLTDDEGDPIGPLFLANGAVGSPSLTNRDDNAGIFFSSAQMRFSTSGVERIRVNNQGIAMVDIGTEAQPSIYLNGNDNVGIWFPSTNSVAVTMEGANALVVDNNGQVNMPTQMRFRTTVTNQSVTSGSFQGALFDTESYDVGGFRDAVSPSSSAVIPTGGAGLYYVSIGADFDTSAITGNNRYAIRVLVNSVVVFTDDIRVNTTSSANVVFGASDMVELADDDSVDVEVFQDAGTLDTDVRLTLVRINEAA